MLLVPSSEAVSAVNGHIAPTAPDLTATHAQAAVVDTAPTTVAADGHLASNAPDLSETPSQPAAVAQEFDQNCGRPPGKTSGCRQYSSDGLVGGLLCGNGGGDAFENNTFSQDFANIPNPEFAGKFRVRGLPRTKTFELSSSGLCEPAASHMSPR